MEAREIFCNIRRLPCLVFCAEEKYRETPILLIFYGRCRLQTLFDIAHCLDRDWISIENCLIAQI